MSNALTIATPLFISAKMKKEYTTANTEALVNHIVTATGEGDNRITPSMISNNAGTYRAGMGGGASPLSFITMLTWGVCAYANGQASLEALTDGIPAISKHAVDTACNLVKRGGGITAKNLRASVLSAIDGLLALPMKTATPAKKKVVSTVTAPVTAPTAAPVTAPVQTYGNDEVRAQSAAYDAAWAAYGDALCIAQSVANDENGAPVFVSMFHKVADSDKERALTLLAEMAAMLGMDVIPHKATKAKKAA